MCIASRRIVALKKESDEADLSFSFFFFFFVTLAWEKNNSRRSVPN